jgi:two-component system sensor histidine kinase RegB
MSVLNSVNFEENLNLDKKTLIILRWIAIFGQLIAIYLVKFLLNFELPVLFCTYVILVGALTNLYLSLWYTKSELNNYHSTIILFYDLLQLASLLYLTGGIKNPFVIFLIIPAIVSSTFLNLRSTFFLSILTAMMLGVLTLYHLPLPNPGNLHFHVPDYYLYAVPVALIIALIFLTYFGARFGTESRKKNRALNKLEEIIAKEHELETIGLQAAAAVHSLGTPLSTITVIAKELKKEILKDPKHSKDIDLLLSQAKRCSEILKKISTSQIEDDKFISQVKIQDLIEEISGSFEEISNKKIYLNFDNATYEVVINRSSQIIYGIRNFLGNAIKFSKSKIDIVLETDPKIIKLSILDDGPGFPEDILKIIGEPYITTKYKDLNEKSGLGLGTFIGKTLLERNFAKLKFSNSKKVGAKVEISWNTLDIKI